MKRKNDPYTVKHRYIAVFRVQKIGTAIYPSAKFVWAPQVGGQPDHVITLSIFVAQKVITYQWKGFFILYILKISIQVAFSAQIQKLRKFEIFQLFKHNILATA